jgi:hypothetical protein
MVMYKPPNEWERPEMKISAIGLDLAKEIFQIHAVDERGKACPNLATQATFEPLIARTGPSMVANMSAMSLIFTGQSKVILPLRIS